MALDLGTIKGRIEIDYTGALKGINSTRQAVDKLGKTVAGAAKQMAAFGAAAAAGGLAAATKASMDLEQAVASAAAVTREGAKNFDEFKKAAVEAGRASAFSAKDAGDALSYLAMAGFKAAEATKALPGVLSLAAAGGVELARASDIASNILTGFSKNAEQLGHVNDVLVATFTSANVNLEMLGDSMKYVAPVATATGQSLEDMAAAVGVMGDAGIQGSMSGRALRMSLLRLQKPPKAAADAIAELGLKTSDLKGNFLEALSTLDEAGANVRHLSAIFGVEAVAGIQALITKGIPAVQEFSNELENSVGKAADVEKQMLDTLKGQLQILEGSVQTAAASFGDLLSPALKETAKQAIEYTNALSQNKDLQAEVVTEAMNVIDAFADLAEIAGILAAATIEIGKAFKVLVDMVRIAVKPVQAVYLLITESAEAAHNKMLEAEGIFHSANKTAQTWGDTLSGAMSISEKLTSAVKRTTEAIRGQAKAQAEANRQTIAANLIESAEAFGKASFDAFFGGPKAPAAFEGMTFSTSDTDAMVDALGKKKKGKTLAEKIEAITTNADKAIAERERLGKMVLDSIEKDQAAQKKIADEQERQWNIAAKAAVDAVKKRAEAEKKYQESVEAAIQRGIVDAERFRQEGMAASKMHLEAMFAQTQSQAAGMGFEGLSQIAGGAAGGAQMGMAVGGPVGAAAGAIGGGLAEVKSIIIDTITEHKEFGRVMDLYNKSLSGIALPDILGNLIGSFDVLAFYIKETVKPFENLLGPLENLGDISDMVADAAKNVATGVLLIARGFVEVGVFFTELADKFSFLMPDDLKKEIFLANSKWKGLGQELDQSLQDIQKTSKADAERYITNMEGSAEGAKEAIDNMAESAREAARELTNMPQGFKLLLRTFEADDADTGRGGVASTMAAQYGGASNGDTSGSAARAARAKRANSGTSVRTREYPYYSDGR